VPAALPIARNLQGDRRLVRVDQDAAGEQCSAMALEHAQRDAAQPSGWLELSVRPSAHSRCSAYP
jgi:hypothetical protein